MKPRARPRLGRHYFLRPVNRLPPEVERRRRLLTRALPLAVLACASFIAGAATGIPPTPEKDAAKRFTEAWAQGRLRRDARRAQPGLAQGVGKSEFVDDYCRAQETATLRSIDPEGPDDPSSENGHDRRAGADDDATRSPSATIEQELALPFSDGGIAWEESLVFPGLAKGEELQKLRQARPACADPRPRRLRPRRRTRGGPKPPAGQRGDRRHRRGRQPRTPKTSERLSAEGFPPGTPVGISGVEQAFNSRLAGKPGGELLAAGGGGPADGSWEARSRAGARR